MESTVTGDHGLAAVVTRLKYFKTKKHTFLLISTLVLVNVTFLLFSQVKVWRLTERSSRSHSSNKRNMQKENDQVCVHPTLKPFDDHVMRFIRPEPPVVCPKTSDWINIKDGFINLKIPPEISRRSERIRCGIRYVKRGFDDFTVSLSSEQRFGLNSSQSTRQLHDFFRITCSGNDIVNTYRRFHAGIVPKQASIKRRNINTHGLGMNVFMLGLDSVSHMSFLRNLPKSFEYLNNTMGGIVLNGYNIVGDATFNALCPLLTGKSTSEIPPVRKHAPQSVFMDKLPFIWNKYKAEGYITAMSEDLADLGAFTSGKTGFKTQPTDHYMRPFYLAARSDFNYHSKFCYGSRPRFHLFLDWFKQFFKTYKDRPTFAFGFHSEQSHSDNLNLVGTLDKDLHEGLKSLYEEGYLENTIFMLFSDHGSRFTGMRATLQGKQEERLPFFAFVFPKWFKEKYSRAYKSVLTNAKRLSSPFDIHATLQDILTYAPQDVGNTTQRGISLFQEIPKSRSCHDAKIDDHWCACLKWKVISLNDTNVKIASQKIVDHINSFTEKYRTICKKIKISKIYQAFQLKPTEGLKKFKGTIRDDHIRPDLSDEMTEKKTKFQISLYAEPGNALYEATVTYCFDNSNTIINTKDISRLNKYGKTADCIHGIVKDLRKFCYCKNQ